MNGLHPHVLAVALAAGFAPAATGADEPKPAKPSNPTAAALIAKLADVSTADTGYSPYVSGSSFAPLGTSERSAFLIFPSRPAVRSDALRELVRLGAAAVPDLLAHIDDKTPTKLTVRHTFGGFGGLWANKEDADKDDPKAYTLKVGDLCYVALGQIVNREYAAVRYQPTAIIIVSTPTGAPVWCAKLRKEWGGFTAEKHRDALLKDCAGKGDAEARAGAFLRLGYYYPDALENPALEFLSRPWYSHRDSHAFVRDTLYKEIDARKRRDLFDARIKELGDSERDGIREVLYSDLGTREATEEGRLNPPEKGFTDEPRRLLTELYGAPKDVKAKDKPVPEFASAWHVARVIESGLVYDRSAKIDRAARDILAKTTDGTTALACAQRLVGRGHDAEIEAYARKIETLRDKSYREDFKALVAKSAWTPLHAAVWRGHEERVAELIREGAKVNAAAKDGRTPLHVAAAAGNAGAVTPLVASGADLGAKDAAGRTPVEIASAAGDAATVRALVGAGSPITDVLVAATAGKTRDVDRFLRADKTAVRATDAFGRTPLHRAACEGHADVAKQLLDAGADADAGDKEGYTPLHVAAALGRVETCRVLLDGKARVDAAPPDSGTQPIHLAALDGRSDVIKLLVRKGAKPDAKDAHGGTPLQYAAGAGHLPVVEWLVDQKVDLDAKNKSGWSARMLAVTGGHKQVAEFLLKKGAKKSPLEDW